MPPCKHAVRILSEMVEGDLGSDWSYTLEVWSDRSVGQAVFPIEEHTIVPGSASQPAPEHRGSGFGRDQCGGPVTVTWQLTAKEHDLIWDDESPAPATGSFQVVCPGPMQAPLSVLQTVEVAVNDQGIFAWLEERFTGVRDTAKLTLQIEVISRC